MVRRPAYSWDRFRRSYLDTWLPHTLDLSCQYCFTLSGSCSNACALKWTWLAHLAAPFFTAPLVFEFWNFSISFSIDFPTLACNSGLYPNLNKISIQTKNGARTRGWIRLSKRAGALFSKAPWPIIWAVQQTPWAMTAIWFVEEGLVDVRWFE